MKRRNLISLKYWNLHFERETKSTRDQRGQWRATTGMKCAKYVEYGQLKRGLLYNSHSIVCLLLEMYVSCSMNEDKVPFTFCLVRCSSSQYPFVPEIYLLSNVRLNWNQHSWSFWSLVISIPYRDIFLDAYKMSGPSRWAHLSGCKCTRIACPEEWIHWKGGSLGLEMGV